MDERDWLVGAVRGEPRPPAVGGLPDARLAERGGRRHPGSLATAQPLRPERCREPGRMADDDRRARVLRADETAVHAGASREVRGAPAVAGTFSGRARVAQPALVNGAAGAVWAPGGRPRVVFGFTITRGQIIEIDLVADPERLRQLEL